MENGISSKVQCVINNYILLSEGILGNFQHKNGPKKTPQNYEIRKYVLDPKFEYRTEIICTPIRGQLISKENCGAVTSPKK